MKGLETFIGMVFSEPIHAVETERTAMSDPLTADEERNRPYREAGRVAGKVSVFVDGILPGLLLCGTLAAGAVYLRQAGPFGAVSPMMIAIVAGILFRNTVGMPGWAHEGVGFAIRPLLRFAIVLLGLQLTFQNLLSIGLSGATAIVALSTSTFLFTVWFGRLIGCERGLVQLIAAGTAICGASAVVATNTVARAGDEDVAYAVASVTLFGTIALFLFPVIAGLADMAPWTYGFWVGASVHEVAQVAAAAFQLGPEAGETGMIVKLARVMLLAPLVLALGLWTARRHPAGEEAGTVPMPWFVAGFLAMVAVNSVTDIPTDAKAPISEATAFLMAMSLGAVGLAVDVRKLRSRGLKPALLGLAAAVFIGAGGFLLVSTLG